LKAVAERDKLGAHDREPGMRWQRSILGGVAFGAVFFTALADRSLHAADDKTAIAVDEVFADVAKPGTPGCALGVYRHGKIIYEKGYGFANLEENVPIAPSSVFDIGSTSKQFTAASILLLEKQGKLSVNDDVRKYIPELPDYGKKITILNLLNHTSGLRDYLVLLELAGYNTDSVTTDDDALALIARQKALNFDPGSEWLYSNTGFFLLSIVVKRVSGKALRDFAAENIFSPLRMTHTQFRDRHTELVANRAMAYDPKEKSGGYTLDVSYFEQTGDGAVHTSVEDLQKWDENFYSGEIGGKSFLAEMQEQGQLNNGKTLEYAKGLFLQDYRGLHTVRHGGAWGGYRAELLRFPDQHFSVACLCNFSNSDPESRAEKVAEAYLGSLMKPKETKKEDPPVKEKQKPEIAVSAEQLQVYAGDYHSEELRIVYRLEASDGKVRLRFVEPSGAFANPENDQPTYLRSTATDEFEVGKTGVTLHFERGGNHQVKGFSVDAGRTRGIFFARILPGTM
jgi:CubicO group peptidase (beta-lactamase class C family)